MKMGLPSQRKQISGLFMCHIHCIETYHTSYGSKIHASYKDTDNEAELCLNGRWLTDEPCQIKVETENGDT